MSPSPKTKHLEPRAAGWCNPPVLWGSHRFVLGKTKQLLHKRLTSHQSSPKTLKARKERSHVGDRRQIERRVKEAIYGRWEKGRGIDPRLQLGGVSAPMWVFFRCTKAVQLAPEWQLTTDPGFQKTAYSQPKFNLSATGKTVFRFMDRPLKKQTDGRRVIRTDHQPHTMADRSFQAEPPGHARNPWRGGEGTST